MNIVFFARQFYPHIGGVEKHVLKISIMLAKKHKISVVTEKFDSSLKDTEVYKGINIFRIPVLKNEKRKKYEIWSYLEKHREIIKEADIVHAHDVFFWYLPFRLMYPRKKIYVTFHGYEGNTLPAKKAILSHRLAEKLTNGNICVGDYLKKWYGTNPSVVTYGGVDPEKMRNNMIYKPFAKNKTIRILYIGRLEEESAILEYLRFTKRLAGHGLKFSLTVLGDGRQRRLAESYSKKHNLPVKFQGFVPDVEKFLPGVDIVFTSRYLGTLEALRYQKPVFCIYNNAIKRDCFVLSPFAGYIYHAGKLDELSQMFESMINNQDAMLVKIKNGYNWVSTETWEKLTSEYLKLWGVKK